MKLTEKQQEQLTLAIQAGICAAVLLFTTKSWVTDQRKSAKKQRKLTEKQQKNLGKLDYQYQKKLLKQEYRKKLGKK
ncbi:MAG: hypothetical protein Q4F41_09150 [Eubacteriales bacterium]|nr:hypothetical protein [Eubacteriales bacterium]